VRLVALCCLIAALGASCSSSTNRPSDVRIQRPTVQGSGIIEIIVNRLAVRMGPNLEHKDAVLGAARPGQRAVYAVWVVDGEVGNGGFEQLFYNWGVSLIEDAISGAELIQAKRFAEILRRANEAFAAVPFPGDSNYAVYVASIPKGTMHTLDSLADRWFARDDDLERALIAYVEAHPSEFFR
jgi:hypothetical protein